MVFFAGNRSPATPISVHGIRRLLELLYSYSPTMNTLDAYWSCWTPKRRRRIPWTLIGVAGLLFADDEYHGRLLVLLDSYSPTNAMDAYWSCWTPIRRDEYHGRRRIGVQQLQ